MLSKRRLSDDSIHVWPAFTDVIAAIFILMMFFLLVMMIKNYLDLRRLCALEELIGRVENDLDELNDFIGEEDVSVEEGTIVMRSDILFPYDKWKIEDISPKGKERLLRIGMNLKTFILEKESKLFRIVVEGHTDSFGPERYNQELSFKRSQSIVTYWEQNGFSPKDFNIVPCGLGEMRLKELHGSKEEQAVNRRIEIRLMPKFGELIKSLKEKRILTSQ